MMLDKKRQLIEELLAHMDDSQGDDLKAMMDAKKPGMVDPSMDGGKPKGLAIEKVSVMGKPEEGSMEPDGDEDSKLRAELGIKPEIGSAHAEPDGDEMSDDELKELLQKYLA